MSDEFNVVIGSDAFGNSDDVSGWCRNLWRTLRDGGSWAIPRSGLIFQKRGDQFVLIAAMPYDEKMAEIGVTPERLKQQQDADFRLTKEHFARVGVEVTRADS